MKFTKYIAAFLGVAAISAAASAYAAETAYICVNNKWLGDESSGIIVNGTTLVPIRAVNDNLGIQTYWDDADRCVTLDFGDGRYCDMYIGGFYAYMRENESVSEYALSAPPLIWNEKTYVPVRFVSEAMNKYVRWEGAKKLVFIDSELAYAEYLNEPYGGAAQSEESKAQNLLNTAATRYNEGDYYGAREALGTLRSAGYAMTAEQQSRLIDFTARIDEAINAWEAKLAEEASLGDTLFDGGSLNFTYYTKNWNVKALYSDALSLERDGDYIMFESVGDRGCESAREWLEKYETADFGDSVKIISGPNVTDLPENGCIGGVRAYQITYVTEKDGVKTMHKTVAAQDRGSIYRFTMTTDRESWRDEQYVFFDAMMSSTAFE